MHRVIPIVLISAAMCPPLAARSLASAPSVDLFEAKPASVLEQLGYKPVSFDQDEMAEKIMQPKPDKMAEEYAKKWEGKDREWDKPKDKPPTVPLPPAVALLGSGLVGLAVVARRKASLPVAQRG